MYVRMYVDCIILYYKLKFFKLKKSAMCRAELGRFPLNIAINLRILNYLLYLQNKPQDSFVKQSCLISLDLHSNGKISFHSNLMKISESCYMVHSCLVAIIVSY